MDIKEVFPPCFINFFDKKTVSLADNSASDGPTRSIQNQQLVNGIHKTIIRKFLKKCILII